ncbi:N-acetylmuramoyl-L-alanine amidase [Peribacillus acanthi]|uniref:N-acetylmuramoyl-L-alanine amidase n=1 Tax=Peribacillus acanthi TaxID=2171554 RepID=UPI000D3ED5C2|nr:N-acetylmuramoyl-L-alanine amidase [Peribacillus acanthi]
MKTARLLLCFLLAAVLSLSFNNSSKAATTFKDVSTTHRAYKEIMYLSQGAIVTGNTSGYFKPNSIVTRAAAAAMIGRALNLNGDPRTTQFKDVGPGNFASGYIQSAVEKKIITGYKDGTFHPNDPVNRGQMAIMISKAFNYSFNNTVSGAASALKTRGIAQGMVDGSFGADMPIVRGDFSVFLARSIDYKLRLVPTVSFSSEKYVISSDLNVRTGPSTKYPKVTNILAKTKVEVAYKVGEWLYIKTESGEGFAHGAYLADDYEQAIAKKTIVIDPGHGYPDVGAVGFGIFESNVVLDTSLRLKELLLQTPFPVKLTRETDEKVELNDRVAFAKRVNADIFVSVHANAYNGSANGTETYYYSAAATNPYAEDSKVLATFIQKRLLVALELNDRGVKRGNFHVIRENTMPAVLTELGFIDYKPDNDKLRSPLWRQRAAEGIYLGILDYYKYNGHDVSKLYNVVQ